MHSGFLVRPYPDCCTGRKFVINKSCCIWSSTRNGFRTLLFLVYINDMPGYAKSQTRLFADDCLMYRKVSSTSDCTQLQEDLDNLIKWEQQWQMQFNTDKCEVLTITKKRKPLHHDYIIHGHTLQHVDFTKYIGLNISKNLSWNTHVDAITKK